MFSTRNGLYDRAKKRFKISDGMKLFSYGFYQQRKADVQASRGFPPRAPATSNGGVGGRPRLCPNALERRRRGAAIQPASSAPAAATRHGGQTPAMVPPV